MSGSVNLAMLIERDDRIAELEKALTEAQQSQEFIDSEYQAVLMDRNDLLANYQRVRAELAEAQQARDDWQRRWVQSEDNLRHTIIPLRAERDTLRGLLREALSRLHCAHLFISNCPPCRELWERITWPALRSTSPLCREQAEKMAREIAIKYMQWQRGEDDWELNLAWLSEEIAAALQSVAGSEDTRLLDWLEEHCDDLAVTRDLSAGTAFAIDWCSGKSGCPVGVAGYPTLREAVRAAIESEEPHKV